MNSVGGAAAAIHAEQVDAVFRQMPVALAVNFVNAGLTAAALAPFATRALALPWFAAMALVTAVRLAVWLHYRRTPDDKKSIRHFAHLATAGALLAGLVWGIGGVLLLPAVPVPGQIFLTMVIGGMCAGSVVVSASHLPSLLAFLWGAALPIAMRFVVEGATTDAALAAMIIVFAAALSLAGRHLSLIVTETMQLRVDLSEANHRLRAEMAEHQAAEEALRQAQKMEVIGQLTGGIAHDFNNLLTIIIGNIVLASTRAGDCPAIVPLLNAATQAAERGAALTQRLLAFARRQRLDPRPVDVVELVYGIEDMLQRTSGPQISLRILAEEKPVCAHVDVNQLELAVLNLTINARDAMPRGGTVRIGITRRPGGRDAPPGLAPGEYVVLSVGDDGTGMDEATLARAFDPFFTTKDIGAGAGLGLPMVQGFVVQSGGAVRIHSRIGEGTTVELWLPHSDQPPVGRASARPAPVPGSTTGGLLLCDDDDGVRGVLADYLLSLGHAVHEAGSADAALRLLATGADIDLLIIDYAMPGMTGLAAIRRARMSRPDLRVLLITGHAALPDGIGIPVMHKPFTLDELGRRTAELLASRRTPRV